MKYRKSLTDCFYIDLGASNHLVLSKGDLRLYREFDRPVEITATNIGKIHTYGTGHLQLATSASSIEWEVDLEDLYYAPGSMCDWGSWNARGGTSA